MVITRRRLSSVLACLASVFAIAVVVGPVTPAAGFAQEHALKSISCVSKSLCRATVTSGVVEKWNGHTWRSGFRFPGDTRTLASISCPTKDFCAAVQGIKIPGQRGLAYRPVTRNTDGTWDYSVATIKVADFQFNNGLSCTSASFCMLTDSESHYRRWNGTTWTAPISFQNESQDTFLSCASPTMCKATDDPHQMDARRPVWTWNGSSWTVQRALKHHEFVEGLSCPSVSFCMLVHGLHYNILSGSHISKDQRLPNRMYGGLSCTSASFCIGLSELDPTRPANHQGVQGSNRWDGTKWYAVHKLTRQYRDPSCPSQSFCAAFSTVKANSSLFRVNGKWKTPRPVS